MIACPTVEHSGTHFVLNLFEQAGFTQAPPKVGTRIVCHAHFGQKNWDVLDELIEAREPPVVIPVRPLHAIFLSWEARDKNTDLLDGRFKLLTDQIERDPYWLPIEAADRDAWLAEINEGLGLHIETQWPVVGSEKRTAGQDESRIKDQSGYRALRDKYDWFFEQLYRA